MTARPAPALTLDCTGTLTLGARSARLTATEERLVTALAARPGQVIDHDRLRAQVWDHRADDICASLLSARVSMLRQKLARALTLRPIETAFQRGYRWTGPPLARAAAQSLTLSLSPTDWARLQAHIETTGETAADAATGFLRDGLEVWGA